MHEHTHTNYATLHLLVSLGCEMLTEIGTECTFISTWKNQEHNHKMQDAGGDNLHRLHNKSIVLRLEQSLSSVKATRDETQNIQALDDGLIMEWLRYRQTAHRKRHLFPSSPLGQPDLERQAHTGQRSKCFDGKQWGVVIGTDVFKNRTFLEIGKMLGMYKNYWGLFFKLIMYVVTNWPQGKTLKWGRFWVTWPQLDFLREHISASKKTAWRSATKRNKTQTKKDYFWAEKHILVAELVRKRCDTRACIQQKTSEIQTSVR